MSQTHREPPLRSLMGRVRMEDHRGGYYAYESVWRAESKRFFTRLAHKHNRKVGKIIIEDMLDEMTEEAEEFEEQNTRLFMMLLEDPLDSEDAYWEDVIREDSFFDYEDDPRYEEMSCDDY